MVVSAFSVEWPMWVPADHMQAPIYECIYVRLSRPYRLRMSGQLPGGGAVCASDLHEYVKHQPLADLCAPTHWGGRSQPVMAAPQPDDQARGCSLPAVRGRRVLLLA